MKIEAEREGGSAVLRLGGRLDREWAEHLSNTLEDLLRDGVRSVNIDLSRVTYVSSAATKVLTRWQQELALLRGEVFLRSVPPAVRETFAIAGWDSHFDALRGSGPRAIDLRRSSWYSGGGIANSGQYQMSSGATEGVLTCRLHGQPDGLTSASCGPDSCATVPFPDNVFGLGLGAIGDSYEECREQIGELVAVAGCIAYFPSDGARMADYLIGNSPTPPRAVLASGLSCEGAFSKLVRFNPKPEADAVPLSELAGVCLDAAGGKAAGMVIAGETAGLSGARLRRSPAGDGASPMRFDAPALREWLSFAPERTYSVATALIAGVAARAPVGPLAAHLRPLGGTRNLYGHFHAVVFSYHPLPQRTVELGALVRGLFDNHQLRDVLHLLWDDRGEAGVGDSALVRGVGWVGPVTQVA
jgi:anti-anti-sigma factor